MCMLVSLKSRTLILTTFSSSLCQFWDIVNSVDDIFTQFALPAFYKVRVNHKSRLVNTSFCIKQYLSTYIDELLFAELLTECSIVN